ncbi:MAG: type VI secretion system tube protein Hcp [Planctomycetes bacterium]|nr:type VI secretion system tube protein Hcp [Planctomycetota bacterium]
MAETSVFIQLDAARKVSGSATSEGYEGWIFADKLEFGIERERPHGAGPGGATGGLSSQYARPDAKPITIRKQACLASCDIYAACTGQLRVDCVRIHVCAPSTGGKLVPYLIYELRECVFLGYELQLRDEKGVEEKFVLDYFALTVTFKEWDEKNRAVAGKDFVQHYDFDESHGAEAAGGSTAS